MTNIVQALKIYRILCTSGISPILHSISDVLCQKNNITFNTHLVATTASNIITYGMICSSITYAICRQTALTFIISLSIVASVALAQLCDLAIRIFYKGENTYDALENSMLDTGIIYGVTTGLILAPIGGLIGIAIQ